MDGVHFYKSSKSCNAGCVETAFTPAGEVIVRHSKDRGGPVLVFSAHEWGHFVAGVKADEFDMPAGYSVLPCDEYSG